ncbi:hypothetical protein CP880_02830 [Cutibacterium namnetense]|uniref:ABC transporter permease n=2 Tax=Cutibacterium namnetense TaxID=1574624 RepID=A0ABX9IBP5_9ACTN|nr:hypothetical protein CP880_02830 [Cutibacterium namnetense]
MTGATKDQEEVARRSGYTPVLDESLRVTGHDSVSTATVRTTVHGGKTPGILTKGSFPSSGGEIAVSIHLAQSLNVQIGDTVSVGSGCTSLLRISGLIVQPLSPELDFASRTVPAELPHAPTLWLGDSTPKTIDSANPPQVTIIGDDFGDQNANPIYGILSNLLSLRWVLLALGSGLIILFDVALRRSSQPIIDGLNAAGMSQSKAWSSLHGALFLPRAMALLIGGLIVYGLQPIYVQKLGLFFGEYWSPVLPELTELLLVFFFLVLIPLLVSLISTQLAEHRSGRMKKVRRSLNLENNLLRIGGAVGALSGALMVYMGISILCGRLPFVSAGAAIPLGFLSLLTIPWLDAHIRTVGLNPITAKFARTTSRRRRISGLLVGFLLFGSFSWALAMERTASDNTTSDATSNVLQVVGVPDSEFDLIQSSYSQISNAPPKKYAMLAGHDGEQVLAISEEFATCWEKSSKAPEQRLEECGDDSPTTVVLDNASVNRVLPPSNFTGRKFSVAVVNDAGMIKKLQPATVTPGSRLEADVASVVLVGSKTPAGKYLASLRSKLLFVTLPEYLNLDSRKQSLMRSILLMSTPTAFPQSNSNPDDAVMLRSIGLAVGLTTALVGIVAQTMISIGERESFANELQWTDEFSGGQLGRRERISGVLTLVAWTIIVTGSSAWCTWISLPHNGNGISMVMLIIPILLAVVCSFIYFLTSKVRAAV